MASRAPDRVVLEDDERDTVYSFSESCSTVSSCSAYQADDASDPCTASVAVGAGDKRHPYRAQLLPGSAESRFTRASFPPDCVVVRAHVRCHLRLADPSSPPSLRARSCSSDLARRASSTASLATRGGLSAATTATTSTSWIPLSCVLPPTAMWRRRQRVTLDLGRALLSSCLTGATDQSARKDDGATLIGRRSRSVESQVDQFIVPTISRQHARLTFLLDTPPSQTEYSVEAGAQPTQTGPTTTTPGPLPTHTAPRSAPRWRCDAMEVVDLVSATSYHDVPLHPHHRYRFPTRSAVAQRLVNAAPSLTDALGGKRTASRASTSQLTVSLNLGRWCTAEVVLETPAQPNPATPTTTSNAASAARQTIYLDVDSASASATHTRDASRRESLGTDEVDAVLSLMTETEPVLLVRGKTRARPRHSDVVEPSVAETTRKRGKKPNTAAEGVAVFIDSGEATDGGARASTVATKANRSSNRSTSARSSTVTEQEPPRKRVPTNSDGAVVFTTGMALSASEERRLKAAHVRVNPPLSEASRAKVLVVQPPLNRSVKLLTVLPHVDTFVSRPWLEEVMERSDPGIATQPFTYAESKTAKSIESTNGFDLAQLLRVPPAERQRLFAGLRFFVHSDAAPQDPPSNDLKTVLTASGGSVCKSAARANVLVVPSLNPTKACWKSLGAALSTRADSEASPFVVTPDDVFKSVLRQQGITASTVPSPQSHGQPNSATLSKSPRQRSSTRRATQTPRASRKRTARSTSTTPRRSTGSKSTRKT